MDFDVGVEDLPSPSDDGDPKGKQREDSRMRTVGRGQQRKGNTGKAAESGRHMEGSSEGSSEGSRARASFQKRSKRVVCGTFPLPVTMATPSVKWSSK